MRRREMLLGLLGLALLGAAGAEETDRATALRQRLSNLEALGRARVLKERRPDQGQWVSRRAAVQALDAEQQVEHQSVLAMLRKLGQSEEPRSGPQIGQGVPGGFVALFLNGIPQHAGKNRCPV